MVGTESTGTLDRARFAESVAREDNRRCRPGTTSDRPRARPGDRRTRLKLFECQQEQ